MKGFLEQFTLAGKTVLDVGTGKGEMIDVLNDAGFIAAGIEASLESVTIGKSFGRNMIHGYIGDSGAITDGPYDAFVCLNYLEHLPNPGAVIRIIYNNTTENAAGYITVPNFDYLLTTKTLYEFVADHISYFTEDTLVYAFETNGFMVVDSWIINNGNDIAIQVLKRSKLNLSPQYAEVEELMKSFSQIVNDYTAKGKRVAVWGAGHRTLALIALSRVPDIAYIVDSAKFKQGKFAPISHLKIVSPDTLKEDTVDLVIVMVPGIYPDEVLKTLKQMNLKLKIAILSENKIESV